MNANPLKQYFRRPEIYLKLPSGGKFYPADSIDLPDNQELPVYPMTAIDEITSKTPDALFNGSAVADIIKSCVPAIKDPWSMPSMDLDAILLAIRSATNGNELEINSTCPSCTEESKYGINLASLLGTIKSDDYDNPLVIGELQIKFKPLTYKEANAGNMSQFLMQRQVREFQLVTDEDEEARNKKSSELMKVIQKLNIDLIANTVESISVGDEKVNNREHLHEFIEKCDRNAFEKIRTHVTNIRQSSTIQPQKLRCVSCSHEYTQELALNITDFFE
jgi:hypothetical protein